MMISSSLDKDNDRNTQTVSKSFVFYEAYSPVTLASFRRSACDFGWPKCRLIDKYLFVYWLTNLLHNHF